MRLLKLEAKNVFSLGEVSLDLEGRGLTLVTGYSEDEGSSNGAGKSSLANKAILWALWGETAGGLRADAVLNRHGKRKARASVTFVGVDGAEYLVTRARPARLTLERAGGNEWIDVTAKTAKDTQTIVDRALGIDFKTFIQTSFFGQGRNLSYPSLTPKEQKAVLEQILPMEEVDKWAAYADTKFKEIQKLVEEAQTEESLNQHSVNVLTGRRDAVQRQAEEYHQDQVRKIMEIEAKIENIHEEFKDDQAKLEILEKQIESIDRVDILNKIEKAGSNMSDLKERIIPTAERIFHQAQSSLDQWKARKTYLIGEINTLESATACPTCLRPYDDTEGVEKRLQNTRNLIQESENNILLAYEAASHYQKTLSDVRRDFDKALNLSGNLAATLITKSDAEREAKTIKDSINNAKTILRNEKERIQNTTNPYNSTRAEIDHELTLAEAEKLEASKKVGQLLGEYEHLEYWKNVYSKELKLKLFEDACPYLDSRTAYHMERLKNRQIHVEFSTIKRLASGKAKEEFNVNVWSETGGMGFDSLSGGEQQMVNFGVGLALADLAGTIASGASGFLILDEPFSELDARNSEAIVEYLTGEMRQGKDTIFLISNEETLKGLVPNRIHVVKSRGVSSVQSI